MRQCIYAIGTNISTIKNDSEPDFLEKLNKELKDVGAKSPFKYIIREGQCKEVEDLESITVSLSGIDHPNYTAVVSIIFNDREDKYVHTSKLVAYMEKAQKINRFIEEVILPKYIVWVNERCQYIKLTIQNSILKLVTDDMKIERKDLILLELDPDTIKFNNYNESDD